MREVTAVGVPHSSHVCKKDPAAHKNVPRHPQAKKAVVITVNGITKLSTGIPSVGPMEVYNHMYKPTFAFLRKGSGIVFSK